MIRIAIPGFANTSHNHMSTTAKFHEQENQEIQEVRGNFLKIFFLLNFKKKNFKKGYSKK